MRNPILHTLYRLRVLTIPVLAIVLLAGCVEQKRGGRQGRYRKGGQRVFRGPQQSSTAQPQPAASTTTETPQAPNSEAGWHFNMRWMHVENIAGPKNAPSADEYMAKSRHKAALVLTADGAEPVPAQGWALCFNAGFFMRIDEEEFKKNNPTVKLVSTGIVGRYRIEPGAGFQPLAKGQSLTISYIGKRMVMLESDRPGGFYLVSVVPGELERILGGVPRRASGAALWIVYDPVKAAPPAPEPIGPRSTAKARFARYARLAEPAEAQPALPLPRKITQDTTHRIDIRDLESVENPDDLTFESAALADVIKRRQERGKVAEKTKPATLAVNDQLGLEAYRLTLAADGLKIEGGSPAGVFYGIQTFDQLIGRFGNGVPYTEIDDVPQMAYRGLMIDICRHFFGKGELKKVIDVMAHYKLNKLQLHLNDDEAWRIEIPSLPELTTIGARRGHYVSDGKGNVQMLPVMFDDDSSLLFSARDNDVVSGYLSGDDYIEIVQYAHDRHVEVIPEIDVPGHSRAAIQALKNKPGYVLVDPDDRSEHVSPQGFTDNIVNPACEGTYRFLEEVFKTLNLLHQAAFVPLEHIHIGGDETPIQAWTLSPLCKAQGYENVDPKVDRAKAEAVHKKIRRDFSRKLYEIIDKTCGKNVKIGSWHENAPYIEERLADGRAYVTDWDLDANGTYGRIRAGQPTVLSNPKFTYLDMAYANHPCERGHFWAGFTDTLEIYEYRPFALVEPPLEVKEQAPVMGMQAQLWSETVTHTSLLEEYLMPRLLAFAERAWNPNVSQADMEAGRARFAAHVGSVAIPDLDRRDFDYHIPLPGAVDENGRLRVNLPFPGFEIRYTTDGTQPKLPSPVYDAQNPPPYDRRIKLYVDRPGRFFRATRVVSLDEE